MAATLDDIKELLEKQIEQTAKGKPVGPRPGATAGGVEQSSAELEAINAKLREQATILSDPSINPAAQAAAKKEYNRLLTEEGRLTARLTKLEKKHAAELGKVAEAMRDSSEAAAAGIDIYSDFGSNLSSVGGGLGSLIKGLGKGGGLAGIVKSAAGALQGLAKAAGNFFIGTAERVSEMQKVRGELMRTTGATAELGRTTMNVYETMKMNELGPTLDEVADSTKALMNNTTDFTMLSGRQQGQLIETAATLNRLGVSNEDFGKGVQEATKSMGVSMDDADELMLGMRATAQDLGIPVGQLTGDFANMGGELAKLGDNGVKAFKDLARTSKITGIEMKRLLDMTNKFDTFEGAASQAGQLNAALGGNFVNAMELMDETDPAKRFEMIRDAINASGKSFQDMGYHERKFFAEASGLGDAAALARAMSGDMSDLTGNIGKNDDSMAGATEQAEKLRGVLERLDSRLQKAEPNLQATDDAFADLQKALLDAVSAGADMWRSWIDGNEGLLMTLSAIAGVLGNFPILLKPVWWMAKKVWEWGKKGIGRLTGWTKSTKALSKTTYGLKQNGQLWVKQQGKFAKHNVLSRLQKFNVRLMKMGHWFKNLGPRITNFAKSLGPKLMNVLKGIGPKFAQLGSRIAAPLINGVSKIMAGLGRIGPFLSRLPSIAGKALTRLGGVGVAAIGSVVNMVRQGFSGVLKSAQTAGSDFKDWIGSWFLGLGYGAAQAIDFLSMGLLESISRMTNSLGMSFEEAWEALDFGFIGETFVYMFDEGIKSVKSFLGIASRSTVFEGIGSNIVDSLLWPFTSLGPMLAEKMTIALDYWKDKIPAWAQSLMGIEGASPPTIQAPAMTGGGGATGLAGAVAGRSAAAFDALSDMVTGNSPQAINQEFTIPFSLDGNVVAKKTFSILGDVVSAAINGE